MEADKAACTVASYLAKKEDDIIPPRVGVMSCQASRLFRILYLAGIQPDPHRKLKAEIIWTVKRRM